ncbi:hypothetical protein FNV43_RR19702 [Rhamnella rubrinervis]|uniref:Uncharacterized protein n=1 Tax=Rhamnella rubrinervis TaxID=2594499 RepID=A0A8K0DZA3_9ROSA|nr:hypothetical protein FNV43_RR19702 [Rhamnella rubrinervis]
MAAKTFIGIPTLVRIVARIFVLFHLLHINNRLSYHTLLGYFPLTSPSSSDDPSDTVRVSAGSRLWNHLVIENGLCKQLCFKKFPKLASAANVIEANNEIEPIKVNLGSSMEWECLRRKHRVYSSAFFCEKPFRKTLNQGPLMMVDEIFDTILPPRLGYIAEQQLKVPKERAKTTEGMNEELLKQVAELNVCQDQMEASLYERLRADIRHHYEDQGWSTSNSLPSFIHDNNINCE